MSSMWERTQRLKETLPPPKPSATRAKEPSPAALETPADEGTPAKRRRKGPRPDRGEGAHPGGASTSGRGAPPAAPAGAATLRASIAPGLFYQGEGAMRAPMRVFPRQRNALAWWDAHPTAGYRLFSEERAADGRRAFLVGTSEQLWRRLLGAPAGKRHLYEILAEGRGCHLYLDLEFPVAANPGVDGGRLTDAAVAVVRAGLERHHGLRVPEGRIVELDSSTEGKFSRHVVFRAPGHAFRSNVAAGAFLRRALADAAAAEGAPGPLPGVPASLTVAKAGPGGGWQSFVDLAVYTKNRAFRLVGCSKFGKAAVLLPTERFAGAGGRLDGLRRALSGDAGGAGGAAGGGTEKLVGDFEASLTTQATGWGSATDREVTLIGDDVRAAARGGGGGGGGQAGPGPRGEREGDGRSPFGAVDAFVEAVCTQDGAQGRVSRWSVAPGSRTLWLGIRGNRWCGRIGRAHRSNGVYYVVDLEAGTWSQRCHDPECGGYRSPAMPLPEEVRAEACGIAGAEEARGRAEAAGWTQELLEAALLDG